MTGSTLSQSQINQTDTIYVIKDDLTLTENITIPEGCVLEFDGGSLSNGTLVGNDTQISAPQAAIFEGITIDGTWNVEEIYAIWFSDIEEIDKIKELVKLSSDVIHNNIYIPSSIECPMTSNAQYESQGDVGVALKSNTVLYLDGTISLVGNSANFSRVIHLRRVTNITIKGSGSIIGDRDTHIGTDGEGQHGIAMWQAKNITIDGITITKCMGDCIYAAGNDNPNEDVTIVNCDISYARRCGISASSVKGCYIFNNYIHNTGGGWAPGTDQVEAAIDCELNEEQYRKIQDVIIENNYINDNIGIYVTSTEPSDGPENITIKHNRIIADKYAICAKYTRSLLVKDNYLESANSIPVNIIAGSAAQSSFYPIYKIIGNTIKQQQENLALSSVIELECVGNTFIGSIYVEGSKNITGLVFRNNILKGNLRETIQEAIISNNDIYGTCFSVNKCFITNNIFRGTVGRIGTGSIVSDNIYTIDISENNVEPIIFEDLVVFTNNKVELTGLSTPLSFIKLHDNCTIQNCQFKCSVLPASFFSGGNSRLSSLVFSDNVIPQMYAQLNDAKYVTVLNKIKGDLADAPYQVPIGHSYFASDIKKCVYFDGDKYIDETGTKAGYNTYGPIANRPSPNQYNLEVGHQYFCTDKKTSESTENGMLIIYRGQNIWVDSLGREVTFRLVLTLEHLTASPMDTQVVANEPYTTTLIPDTGYGLPTHIIVKMGNTILTQDTDYTYDNQTGEVNVLGIGGSGGITVGSLYIVSTGV